MTLNRLIPILTLDNKKLIKTKKFTNPSYIGDPINTLRLFNSMNCPEIILIDRGKTIRNEKIDYNFLKDIFSESSMPISYGGGVKDINEINNLIITGCEKVSINSEAQINKKFVKESVKIFGSSTIIISLDIYINSNEIFIYNYLNQKRTNLKLIEQIKEFDELQVGEYLINFVDLDGEMNGMDKKSIEKIIKMTNAQVTFCGGASSYDDIKDCFVLGAKSIAAGSLFSYQSKDGGVLINYPSEEEYLKLINI